MLITSTKPLLPTLRQSKRYIRYKIHTARPCGDAHEVADAIRGTAIRAFGLWGSAKMNMVFMHRYFNAKEQYGIVRVEHNHVDAMRALLGNVRAIGTMDACLQTTLVSGSLKKVR